MGGWEVSVVRFGVFEVSLEGARISGLAARYIGSSWLEEEFLRPSGLECLHVRKYLDLPQGASVRDLKGDIYCCFNGRF